jgi:hypothetical protein
VIFDAPKVLTIQSMDGRQQSYYMQLDSSRGTVSLWNIADPHWNAKLTLEHSQPDSMSLEGQFGGRHITAKLDRIDLSDPDRFPLINRGLHWVNPNMDNR